MLDRQELTQCPNLPFCEIVSRILSLKAVYTTCVNTPSSLFSYSCLLLPLSSSWVFLLLSNACLGVDLERQILRATCFVTAGYGAAAVIAAAIDVGSAEYWAWVEAKAGVEFIFVLLVSVIVMVIVFGTKSYSLSQSYVRFDLRQEV